MFNLLTLKANLKTFFLAAIGLLSPIKYLLILVGLFILIDTVVGIWAARKQHIVITSRRLSSVLSKMLVYQGIVILAYALDKLILGGIVSVFIDVPLLVTKIATLIILVNESFSIDEKVRILNKNKGTWFYFKRAVGLAKLVKKQTKDLIGDEPLSQIKPEVKEDENGDLVG
jgi:hypothetical protein